MKRQTIAFLLFLSAWSLDTAAQQPPAQVPLAVTGVTVIDVRNGSRTPNATIIIEGGRITTVGVAAVVLIPAGSHVVEARGKYVIPGLWDMHVHIQNQQELDVFFPLLVAHGVLGIRDTGGLLPREYGEFGQRHQYAPHVVASGLSVDGPAPAGTADIAAVVDSRADDGADYIKILSMVPRDRLAAIISRARQRGLQVAGHVPVAVSATEASDLGLRSMEHLLEIHLSVSTRESELRAVRVAALAPRMSQGELTKLIAFPPLEPLLTSWSDIKADELFRRLARNETWQDPTLVLFRAWAATGEASFWRDPRLAFIPKSWLESWHSDHHWGFREVPHSELPAFYAHITRWHRAQLDLTRRMHRAGIRFLAGTDASQWNFLVPGASLHDELALLVESGLSPLEAIQAATINAAEYFGTTDFGLVTAGKQADLVLLDADPVANIRNTTRISAVILSGRLLDRGELNRILEEARTRAALMR